MDGKLPSSSAAAIALTQPKPEVAGNTQAHPSIIDSEANSLAKGAASGKL